MEIEKNVTSVIDQKVLACAVILSILIQIQNS